MDSEPRRLLKDAELDRSATVANSQMNRERGIAGRNSYAQDLGFSVLEHLRAAAKLHRVARWLDLCCGSGRALIEAGEHFQRLSLPDRVSILGVDLVPMFRPVPPGLDSVRLMEASLAEWFPQERYHLVTSVHGLHYVGDKLGLISRAAGWLEEDGLFAANLDLSNVRWENGEPVRRALVRDLRRAGMDYDAGRHLVICRGRREVSLPYEYVGADDAAGPNYTGQPAVDSYYRRLE
jgi:SAM-dependent methyltransferase